jgi:hypothetical protein
MTHYSVERGIDHYRTWLGILRIYATKVLSNEFELEINIDLEENTVRNMT